MVKSRVVFEKKSKVPRARYQKITEQEARDFLNGAYRDSTVDEVVEDLLTTDHKELVFPLPFVYIRIRKVEDASTTVS